MEYKDVFDLVKWLILYCERYFQLKPSDDEPEIAHFLEISENYFVIFSNMLGKNSAMHKYKSKKKRNRTPDPDDMRD